MCSYIALADGRPADVQGPDVQGPDARTLSTLATLPPPLQESRHGDQSPIFSWSQLSTPVGHQRTGIEPCTSGRLCNRHKFYGKYALSGTGLFCRIQEEAEDGGDLQSALDQLVLMGVGDDAWTATYTPMNTTATTQIHAMHLAASLGSIKAMEWIMSRFGPEIVNRKASIKTGSSQTYEPHYTPLMSAIFMSQVDAVMWLLDNKADAASKNHDGFTPLHMLALYGLPHVRAEGRLRAMQMAAARLVERRADLASSSGPLKHRKDPYAENERNKRPVEIAALKTCAYPKQMLHLLTKSYQCPEQSELFREVHIVAKANPSGAQTLMENFKANVTGQLKERLIQEVNKAARDGEHIDMFCSILRMSPVAGAELLGLLLCEPKVRDPHRYPLPLYNYLPNRVMRCTYQWVHNWDQGQAAPRWHKDFAKELPGDPLQHDHVYEVKVRVLAFPGILNLQVLSVLSRVWDYGQHLRIFAQLPVQAIINCLWSRSMRTFWFMVIRELATLVVLLFLGINPPGPENVRVLRLFHIIIVSEMLNEVWGLTSGLLVCGWLAGMPRATYFWEFNFSGFVQCVLLLMLVRVNFPINTPEERVAVSVNIMMSCFELISALRTVPELGPLIIAVYRSFVPMKEMFLVIVMVLVTFFFAFATIKDENRDVLYVGLYLYRALVLNDGDAMEAISGFDYGKEQTLDFNQEQFTGDLSQLIMNFSSGLMVIATFVFSLVLLNLVIGIYAKFYDEMRPRAELLFHQQRAKACVIYLLSPGLLHLALGESLKRYKTMLFLSAAGCMLMSTVLLLLPAESSELWRLAALSLTLGMQLFQAAIVTHISHPDSTGKYLWVSYRSDYSEEFYLDITNQELNRLRRQLSRAETTTQVELAEIKRLLAKALMTSCPSPRTVAYSL